MINKVNDFRRRSRGYLSSVHNFKTLLCKQYPPFGAKKIYIYIYIFVRGHYLFREANKTMSFEEQIMSKDKCTNIFSRQMKTIVFIILQIFFATRAVLKIGTGFIIHQIFSLARDWSKRVT